MFSFDFWKFFHADKKDNHKTTLQKHFQQNNSKKEKEEKKMASCPLTSIPVAPADATFGLVARFRACEAAQKVNVSVGAYRTDEGKPWVLPSVRAAEKALVADDSLNKEYLPIEGFPGLFFYHFKTCLPPVLTLFYLFYFLLLSSLFSSLHPGL